MRHPLRDGSSRLPPRRADGCRQVPLNTKGVAAPAPPSSEETGPDQLIGVFIASDSAAVLRKASDATGAPTVPPPSPNADHGSVNSIAT